MAHAVPKVALTICKHSLLFPYNNGSTNAPPCYVIVHDTFTITVPIWSLAVAVHIIAQCLAGFLKYTTFFSRHVSGTSQCCCCSDCYNSVGVTWPVTRGGTKSTVGVVNGDWWRGQVRKRGEIGFVFIFRENIWGTLAPPSHP